MEALGKIIREELGLKQLGAKMVKYKEGVSNDCNSSNCKIYESKIVSEEELIPYLDEGWDVVKELKNGKIVIRRILIIN